MQKLLGFMILYLVIGLVYGLYLYFWKDVMEQGFFFNVLRGMFLWPLLMFPGVFKFIGGLIALGVFALVVLS